jgi:hypothetical protein
MAGVAVGQLRISADKRFLETAQGKPFFWMADTAWELFHRLNREDASLYLKTRARQGFNVVQAVALAELDGLTIGNAYGELPLIDRDPSKPNEKYFAHVDWVIAEAGRQGLYVALLPTWGNKVFQASWEKTSDVIFDEAKARAYGEWIGARYRGAKNVIWVLGGDRKPETVVPVWRAMAAGIRAADSGNHLMTYHPNGGASSSTVLHQEPWLDFNLLQSGHSVRDQRNDAMITKDRALDPVKPVIDGEPRYENHPVDWKPAEKGWFEAYDVRQAAYYAVFAGAAGHTYGCHDVWQMLESKWEPVGHARGNWKTSLSLEGARQMGLLRDLMEARGFSKLTPAPGLVLRGARSAMVYLPEGGAARIVTPNAKARLRWFDPRTGKISPAGQGMEAPGGARRGNDWVLLVDW